jgi:superfamily II DNA helicase RecQ
MKVKAFHIRLTKDNLETDQEAINSFMEKVAVKKTVTQLITTPTNFWSILVFYEEQKPEHVRKNSEKIAITELSELNEDEKRIFSTLKQWRHDKASQMNVPSYVVCHNTELMTIAKIKPENLEHFLQIKGFGEQKIAKFGEDIIALLNSI